MKFRFKPIPADGQIERIMHISRMENFDCPEDICKHLVDISGGDLRKSIMLLQSACKFYGQKFTVEEMLEISGYILPEEIKKVYDICMTKSPLEIKNYSTELGFSGYSTYQVMSQLLTHIQQNCTSDLMKAYCSVVCSQVEKRIVEGGSESLNLDFLLLKIGKILSSKEP